MRKLAILLICLWATPASAQLMLYEGFDYDPGELLATFPDPNGTDPNGQLNLPYGRYWRRASTAGTLGDGVGASAPGITAGSLSNDDLPDSTGNSALFDHTQLGTARIGVLPSGGATSGVVYWSGLFKVNTLGTLRSTVMLPGATNGVMLGSFNNTTGAQATVPTVVGGLLLIRPDFEVTPLEPKADSYQIGTASSPNNNDRIFSTDAPQMVGDTVFIVASYEFVTGTFNDVVKMWINPAPASFGAAEDMLPAFNLTGPTPVGADLGSISSFHLRNNNQIYEGTNWQFDELRVGRTWASVTSTLPPATLAGDYFVDNMVNNTDYNLWAATFGGQGAGYPADGDADGDVDGVDFLTWQANFGAPEMLNSAVPEPASLWLAGLAVGGALVGRRGRRR